MSDFPTGTTESGRTVIICYCGGGGIHKWRPNGGGFRILACPSDEPQPKTTSSRRSLSASEIPSAGGVSNGDEARHEN